MSQAGGQQAPAPRRGGGAGGGGGGGRQGGGGFGSRPGGGGRRGRMPDAGAEDGLVENVVRINRTSKTVKGGRRFGFSTIVVVGDRQGRVGYGFGKANEVPGSVQKGLSAARRRLVRIPIVRGTIPYEVTGHFGASDVYMRPASAGTGVIASKSVRAVMEVLGVTDILTKCRGSTNPINVVKAVLAGLQSIRSPEEQMRLRGVRS